MSPARKAPGRPGRDEPPAPSRRRGIRIPLEVDQALERLAVDRQVSVHSLIRTALEEWLEAQAELPE